jgi:acyl dehydratase
MPIDPTGCGVTGNPFDRSWTSTDCILYSLAVGAGDDDPSRELAFTTENTNGVEQQALPTFGAIIGRPTPDVLGMAGTFDPAMLVHAGQSVTLHRPIPVEGAIRATTTLTEVEDKRSGALITFTTESLDVSSGEPLLTTTSALFVRGEGGFGGARTAAVRRRPPERAPDHVVPYATSPGQALLYRLCGDRNPLHSDPAFARSAGFDRPILHGLCAYGFTGRALLHSLCDGDPARFGSIEGRFSRPTLPGDMLIVSIWLDDEGVDATFTTTTHDGATVISDGRFAPRAVTEESR